MCGITGWLDWERDLTAEAPMVERMSETLAPRGPDAQGMWVSPRAILGHRRLIVVDPLGGSQPMVAKRGEQTYCLVYNGELYNTEDLRSELAARGYSFAGHSDTEVLLKCYMEWGPDCVSRLNGIFAFAVWEQHSNTLFMARDRLGVKPLFYWQKGSSLLFASELKALLAHPLVRPQLQGEGLAEVFVLGPARTPGHGVFSGVSEVKPGWSLLHSPSGTKHIRYWQLESKPHEDDTMTTLERVRYLFVDAVSRQLIADVPVCTLLSGGLDSTAITAVAAAHFFERNQSTLHTFSVDYAENDQYFKAGEFQPNSDSDWVEYVAKSLETSHSNIVIPTTELAEALESAVLARDLPGMADIDSSLLLFCREIKKRATVALSGECADEIFGGYPWFHSPVDLNSPGFPWCRDLSTRTSVLSPELLEIIRPAEYMQRRYQETLADVPRLPGEAREDAHIRDLFYLNINWFMANLLDRKDRMSMACGLEVRVPFADHRLLEYVWNIPWKLKNLGGMEKGILRQALHGIIPEKVLERRKSPYPKTHNPAYLQAVSERLLEILHDPGSPLLPLINRKNLLASLEGQEEYFSRPWFGQLMGTAQLYAFLIQTDVWLRHYNIEY
ncbi:MAG TPA: asparagine synthase (glutamine-hydrolyzing) [Bacillota bacterium]|nr:asparagine synthase (glutamine-hydrolyzing) [Bacillota bacterium]